jgi:hypothetical protein
MCWLRWQNAWFLALTLMLGAASWTHAESVELFATRDTTLYEDASGAVSNGAGEILLVGRIGSTGQPTACLLRRALIFFDLAGSDLIPAGATIDSVELRLSLLRESVQDPSARIVTLHRLEADWGEGSSNAGPFPGSGARLQNPTTPPGCTPSSPPASGRTLEAISALSQAPLRCFQEPDSIPERRARWRMMFKPGSRTPRATTGG